MIKLQIDVVVEFNATKSQLQNLLDQQMPTLTLDSCVLLVDTGNSWLPSCVIGQHAVPGGEVFKHWMEGLWTMGGRSVNNG